MGQELVTPSFVVFPLCADPSVVLSQSFFSPNPHPLLSLFDPLFFLLSSLSPLLHHLKLFLDAILIGVSIPLHSHPLLSLSLFLLFPSVL